MRGSDRLPVKLDRAAVVAATPPGPLWRDAAFLVGLAGVALLVLPALLLADARDVPVLASVALLPGMLALLAPWFWWQRWRRHRRLLQSGQRFVATDLRTVSVNWLHKQRRFRWTIVAQWRDAAGVERTAWSADYDYDPAPLISGRPVFVLADPADPANAVLSAEGLPPRRHHRLEDSRRRSVPPDPHRRGDRIAVIVALVVMLGMAAWIIIVWVLPMHLVPPLR